jgi:hypothetical protein
MVLELQVNRKVSKSSHGHAAVWEELYFEMPLGNWEGEIEQRGPKSEDLPVTTCYT